MPVTKKINQKCSEERDWYFMEGIYMKYDAWVHKKKIKWLISVLRVAFSAGFYIDRIIPRNVHMVRSRRSKGRLRSVG